MGGVAIPTCFTSSPGGDPKDRHELMRAGNAAHRYELRQRVGMLGEVLPGIKTHHLAPMHFERFPTNAGEVFCATL